MATDDFFRATQGGGCPRRTQGQPGGQSIRTRHDRLHGTAEAFDSRGRPMASTMAFWFAWVAFHPRTEVLRAQ